MKFNSTPTAIQDGKRLIEENRKELSKYLPPRALDKLFTIVCFVFHSFYDEVDKPARQKDLLGALNLSQKLKEEVDGLDGRLKHFLWKFDLDFIAKVYSVHETLSKATSTNEIPEQDIPGADIILDRSKFRRTTTVARDKSLIPNLVQIYRHYSETDLISPIHINSDNPKGWDWDSLDNCKAFISLVLKTINVSIPGNLERKIKENIDSEQLAPDFFK